MAVKPVSLTLVLHHHITTIRPSVHCMLPHQPTPSPPSSCAFHQDCCHQKEEGLSTADKTKLPSNVTRWQGVKSNMKNTASKVYQQVTNAKELGKMMSWNIPGITTSSNVQSHRVTIMQPLTPTKSEVPQCDEENLNNLQHISDIKCSEEKPRKRLKLKVKDATARTNENASIKTNIVEEKMDMEILKQEPRNGLSNSENKFEPKSEDSALQVLQKEEVDQDRKSEPPSRFSYGIFDVESIFKRIQEQFTLLESLTPTRSASEVEGSEHLENGEGKKMDKPSAMKYSEEFETGNQGNVYGDVIIQFRQKTDKVEEENEGSSTSSVSTIFRDNLDEWDQRQKSKLLKVSDPRGDISREVSSSFMKEIRTKADMSYLLDQIYLLKSVQLPSIAKSIERFNKKFIKEQSQPVESKQSVTKMVEPESVDDEEVGGFYFDTNAPLMDMTQVMTEMQQLKGSMKKEETLSVRDSPEDTGTKDDIQETRRTKVQISHDSVKARTKSLAVAVSKPSNTALTLLKIQRLCKHLSEYPETREIAIRENLIPILLRQRNHVDDANQAEIRRALSLMGYADPVKGKGIRILSVDGGGSRGVIPIEILKRLEESCQLRIGDMFDYVIGVSSGAVTAFLLSIAKASTEECEQLYKDLSSTVFGRNRFLGTSNLVLNHAFYDTERWIKMLREHFHGMGNLPISETARDASCPKVASVATLMNVGMMRDYLFRNYNLPPGSVSFYQGSSKYCLWEALRASSAAPGYFEEFKLDDHVFQDGGVLTNNPCALAVHECRLLWPDTPIQCVVSVGTGRYDPMDQEFPAEYSSLKTKLFKVLCSATDTEAVHIILKDLLPAGKYFRFNPVLSEDFVLDESKPEKLEQMQKDTREYLARNELKLMQASGVLTREKSTIDRMNDWITLQKKMRIPRQKMSYWRD